MKISRLPSWCKGILNSVTLIEIMIVVAIIAILTAIVTPALVASQQQRQNHTESAKRLSVGDSVFIKGINAIGVINSGNGYYFDILVVGKNGEPTILKSVSRALITSN